MPGHFFRAGKNPHAQLTIIICGGADGSGEELFFLGGKEALDHGYNVMAFHGPGQRGALHENERLVFRQDYEGPAQSGCRLCPIQGGRRLLGRNWSEPRRIFCSTCSGGPDRNVSVRLSPTCLIMDFHLWLLRHIGLNLNRIPKTPQSLNASHELSCQRAQLDYACWELRHDPAWSTT